jgi:hypothetical protein
MEASWWHKAKFRLLLDYHTPDHVDQAPPGSLPSLIHLDPKDIAKTAKEIGVDAVIFYAKDNQGNFHYPSSLGHQLSDLQGRDLVQEFIEALQPVGIRTVAVFQPIRDRRTFDAVPAWRQRYNDGSERIEQGFMQLGQGGHRLVCPLGGAGEAALAQLKELVIKYDLDGVWFDRVGDIRGTAQRYPCFCESCQNQYKAYSGSEIPKEANWNSPAWKSFWAWRSISLLEFQKRAHRIVGDHGSGVGLISNYAFFGMALADPMPVSVDMEAAADATDVASLECQHFRSYLLMSVNPRLMPALTDRSCEMLAWRVGDIGDGVVRSELATEATIHTFLSHGHAATFSDNLNLEGELDKRTVSMLKRVFNRFQSLKPHLKNAKPLPYAAVLFSPSTFTWYGRENPDLYVKEFLGTVRHFLRLHIPFEIISDRHLNHGHLKKYKLLALPNAACMGDKESQAILGWVKKGGVLVASADTSRLTQKGNYREDFSLAELFGVSYLGATDGAPVWMKAISGTLAHQSWSDYPVSLKGSTVNKVTPFSDVEILAKIGTPIQGFDVFGNYVNPVREWGPYPAITLNKFGSGHAMYLAGKLGAADLQWGIAELNAPFRQALNLADPPPVTVDAPSCVELVVQETEKNTWLIHLINLQGEVGRTHRMPTLAPVPQGISEVIPIFNLEIFIRPKISSATEILDGQTLEISNDKNGSKLVLPKLSVTASILVKLS